MSLNKLIESIVWAGLLFLLVEPRAEAYVCLSAGSLLLQVTLSAILLGAASVRAMFLIRYKGLLSRIKSFSKTIQQK